MELNYINEFVVLARVLHFQEAADLLFIGQSSLSKHIKSIETELGEDLFIRSKKKVALSDFGKAWLPYAEQIVNTQREYTQTLLGREVAAPDVNIGYIPLVTLYNFIPFFKDYKKQHPHCQYSFLQGGDRELLDWLQQKKVDFILTGDCDIPEDLYQRQFYTCDTLSVVMPETHPLAGQSTVSLADLKNESLIEFHHMSSLRQCIHGVDPSFGLHPSIAVDKPSVLFDLIQKGMGLSILTHNMASHFKMEGTAIRPISPDIYYEIYMVCPNRKASQVAREFSEYLKNL
ncbi:MAG: LysR family transcriptional regulator [Lachnospiraceae bacterium]|nr:LysR family transcriptional regulator [Lachnospiraceae bacterium]